MSLILCSSSTTVLHRHIGEEDVMTRLRVLVYHVESWLLHLLSQRSLWIFSVRTFNNPLFPVVVTSTSKRITDSVIVYLSSDIIVEWVTVTPM